jgi:hypothetical protein
VGGRQVAWMRGAFNRSRLAVSGAGKPAEAKAAAVDATRANGGAGRANGAPGTPRSLGPTTPFWAGG